MHIVTVRHIEIIRKILLISLLVCLATCCCAFSDFVKPAAAASDLAWLYKPLPVPKEGDEGAFARNVLQAIQESPPKYRAELIQTVLFIAYAKIRYESEVQGLRRDMNSMSESEFLSAGLLSIYKMAQKEKGFSLSHIIAMGNKTRQAYPAWQKDFDSLSKE